LKGVTRVEVIGVLEILWPAVEPVRDTVSTALITSAKALSARSLGWSNYSPPISPAERPAERAQRGDRGAPAVRHQTRRGRDLAGIDAGPFGLGGGFQRRRDDEVRSDMVASGEVEKDRPAAGERVTITITELAGSKRALMIGTWSVQHPIPPRSV
jgi:hypothetical protein